MAKDIHEVIEYLGLKDVLLMGWSMGGPTMLSYWKQFGKDPVSYTHLFGMVELSSDAQCAKSRDAAGSQVSGIAAAADSNCLCFRE